VWYPQDATRKIVGLREQAGLASQITSKSDQKRDQEILRFTTFHKLIKKFIVCLSSLTRDHSP
jgi:hypothetical protein